jgi:5-(carboxyamino)imidazole ribonucleotide synthase
LAFSTTQKIGVLGGGQLGKMLCLAAANLDQKIYILDSDISGPAGHVSAGFTAGDFRKYEDVLSFGQDKDLLTIEIEHVNIDALDELARQGKPIHPHPKALRIIQDKGIQKQFYAEHQLPTSAFQLFDNEQLVRDAVADGKLSIPFVQKTRTAGYDGKGVAVIRTHSDLDDLLAGPSLIEDLVDVAVEIAVIAARNEHDEVVVFPAVEMEFHPTANLVEWLVCPARISPLVAAQAEALAESVIRAFDVCGLLAVEMFLTSSGHLLINEVAPRPHNSGHHTIDSANTSQFAQHLRAITGLPLGDTSPTQASVMINLLGEPDHKGPVKYEGIEPCIAMSGVHIHLYGKATTSPFRKMGHVTVTAENLEAAIEKARIVKNTLKVIAESK